MDEKAIKTYPIIELFGPTIQGEGPAAGRRCWFLRLGGCDFRCSWCDTMYAVDPPQVRANMTRMSMGEIGRSLWEKGFGPEDLLIVSGGNPALHKMAELRRFMPHAEIHIETQGTVFHDWLNTMDLVVVSPKPPSADMGDTLPKAKRFLSKLTQLWALKVVVFDDADLEYAVSALTLLDKNCTGAFLSAGTEQVEEPQSLIDGAVSRFGWLCNTVLEREDLRPYRVGLQQHVLAWPGELAR